MKRPKKLSGATYEFVTGCGSIYITCNDRDSKPYELIAIMGKGGGCAASQCEAIGRVISIALQANAPIKDLIKQLSGISCHSPSGIGNEKVFSCADAIAKSLKTHSEEVSKTDVKP